MTPRSIAEHLLLHAIEHLRLDALQNGIGSTYEAMDILGLCLQSVRVDLLATTNRTAVR